MNVYDIVYDILLYLTLEDLKNSYINKLFSRVLNTEHFWCEWLKNYKLYPTKNYKYIAIHYDLTGDNWRNYHQALKEKDLIVLDYFFINKIDVYYLIPIIATDCKKVLNLALEHYQPKKSSILFALATKRYSLLKILLRKYHKYDDHFKNKIIELININKQCIYMSEESVMIENQIDECFDPEHKTFQFKYWRNQHFS